MEQNSFRNPKTSKVEVTFRRTFYLCTAGNTSRQLLCHKKKQEYPFLLASNHYQKFMPSKYYTNKHKVFTRLRILFYSSILITFSPIILYMLHPCQSFLCKIQSIFGMLCVISACDFYTVPVFIYCKYFNILMVVAVSQFFSLLHFF